MDPILIVLLQRI